MLKNNINKTGKVILSQNGHKKREDGSLRTLCSLFFYYDKER